MGRGTKLTSELIPVVKALHAEKKTVKKIAAVIKKSTAAVQNVIHRMNNGKRCKKLGRPSKITEQFRRAVFRSVSRAPNERITASKLVKVYRPAVGVRRVQQLMQEADYLPWVRMKTAPRLTQDHKEARIKWAKEQLHRSPARWLRTIFSDEKRFCLDGPDATNTTGGLNVWIHVTFQPDKMVVVELWYGAAFQHTGHQK